jgi:spermidine/putrescine transport system ATP-binding protein
MSADVELDRVSIRFGDFVAVRSATLKINNGEFFSFLGPSGCGKTTILRTISGFLEPSEGTVRIGGQDMRGIGPNKRPTALIFQNLALFPLMTVADNIGYGLRVQRMAGAERRRRVDALLNLIALPDQGGKKVSELSGGQRQRVAIARALAVEPQVLLLDEPLSALDLKLRQHMRNELRAIQKRVGITFIYITHDQGEALTMSDRIAVMNAGVIEQIGDGKTIYDNPATSFVASFVGENNPFLGRVASLVNGEAVIDTPLGRLSGRNNRGVKVGDEAVLFVRPEAFRMGPGEATRTLQSPVANVAFEGNMSHIYLKGPQRKDIIVTLGRSATERTPAQGETAAIHFDAGRAIVLPAGKLASD